MCFIYSKFNQLNYITFKIACVLPAAIQKLYSYIYSYIEVSRPIQSLYLLYSIRPLWLGADIMEKLIIVIKIKLAMVKHINVGLFSFSGDITSFWHYVYPFQFNYITIDVSGLNVIFITDSTVCKQSYSSHFHNYPLNAL